MVRGDNETIKSKRDSTWLLQLSGARIGLKDGDCFRPAGLKSMTWFDRHGQVGAFPAHDYGAGVVV